MKLPHEDAELQQPALAHQSPRHVEQSQQPESARQQKQPVRLPDRASRATANTKTGKRKPGQPSRSSNVTYIAQAGVIAALYAALTLLTLTLLGGLAFGPIQLRLSEVVCVLALFTSSAVPGLTIGCALANLIGIALNGSGALGLLDVIGGSAATFIGAWWCWRLRNRVGLALLGPVVANALIVAAYLPLILAAAGFYTLPFTEISLMESYPLMYLFGVLAIGVGQALVIYGLGWPLQAALRRTSLFE